jgi:predicted RNA-binding protein with PIN domain
MYIMIDGYNLLYALLKGKGNAQDKAHLLARLRRYARYTKHAIVVMFDGGDVLQAYSKSYGSVTVWHSGINKTADALILEHMPHYNADALVLVSDDVMLNRQAAALMVVSISPAVFVTCMSVKEQKKYQKQNTSIAIKITAESTPELDVLMEQYMPRSTKEVIVKTYHNRSYTPSKIEKRLQAILRKL